MRKLAFRASVIACSGRLELGWLLILEAGLSFGKPLRVSLGRAIYATLLLPAEGLLGVLGGRGIVWCRLGAQDSLNCGRDLFILILVAICGDGFCDRCPVNRVSFFLSFQSGSYRAENRNFALNLKKFWCISKKSRRKTK